MTVHHTGRYWATGSNTKVVAVHGDFSIEYNSSIKMWRINSKNNIPKQLMGYSPHHKALTAKLDSYILRNKL